MIPFLFRSCHPLIDHHHHSFMSSVFGFFAIPILVLYHPPCLFLPRSSAME
jgi:hypothetical protein